MAGWNRTVPFYAGDMNGFGGHGAEWVSVASAEFTGRLRYVSHTHYNKSVTVKMQRDDGRAVVVSLADFMRWIFCLFDGYTPEWRWTFVKRGGSYFCARAGEPDMQTDVTP